MKFKILMAAALLLLAQSAFAGPFSYDCTDCPQNIPPSGTAGTTTSTLTVADSGTIADLTIFIDAFHTFEGDLTITLSHNGTDALLQDGINGSADYLGGTYGPLAEFVGLDIAGDWVLTIVDNLGADLGILDTWNISGNASMAAPEPGILILMGLGLAGLGFARRRS